jgi:tetratricopeptide (TPR) repeat protein
MSCIEWKAIPRSLLPRAQGGLEMGEAIGTLCGYSFLARRSNIETEGEGEEWYDIHRLVHLATRIWVEKRGDAARATDKALRYIATLFPSQNYDNREVWRAYMPHALRLVRESQNCRVKERSKLCLKVGLCLKVDGKVREAVELLEESYHGRRDLDERDLDRLASQHELAVAYETDGQVEMAVPLLEHVVAVREKTLAEEHPTRLASQHALLIAYRADRQVKKAVPLLEHVVAVYKKTLAEEHPDQLASQHALLMAYQADGQVKLPAIALVVCFAVWLAWFFS